jgi:peptidoglycan/LPS O-acetylase OafA/YrhL
MPRVVKTSAQPPPVGEAKTRHFGRGHLIPLDGLRGLAILAVMASHLFAVNYETASPPLRLVGRVFYWGIWGVDLFFVLSGFLITGILVDSLEGPNYFRNFYMRRVLRIFPLYYGILCLLFALTSVLAIQWHGLQVPLLLYLQNGWRLQPLTELLGRNISLNHLWSLAIEEQFYLVWPFAVFVARTPRRIMAVAITGCVLALCFRLTLWGVWRNGFTTHFNVFARGDALLLGAVLALLYRSDRWPNILRWSRPAFLALAALLIGSLVASGTWLFRSLYWPYAVHYSFVAMASGALLAWSLRAGVFSRLCSSHILRFFGKYSYGLYVLHMTFLPLLTRTIRPFLLHLCGNKAVAVVGTAILVVAISSGAAWLSFHLYEKRFLRLKRYFEYSSRVPPV